jgi:hypothetical protein
MGKQREIVWVPDPADARYMVPKDWDMWHDGLQRRNIPHIPRKRIDGMTRKPALKSCSENQHV